MIADLPPAVFSPDRKYRYVLRRRVGLTDGTLLVILLNPSTADEENDDPTIRRCVDFANRWGYGWLVVCNLFAYRATDPDELSKVDDPVGPENDEHIRREAQAADLVVVGWGEHGLFFGRCDDVHSLLMEAGIPLHCWATNSSGQPKHPLYVPRTQALKIWRA